MKKENMVFAKRLFLFFVFMSLVSSYVNIVSAQEETSAADAVKQVTGIDLDKVPMSEDEVRDKYLTREWGKMAANSSIYGPVHRFLESRQYISNFLFGTNYEISFTFFGIVFLWLFFGIQFGNWLSSIGFAGGKMGHIGSYAIGILFSTILSLIKLYLLISSTIFAIIMNRDTNWARFAIVVCVLILLVLEYYLSRYISSKLGEYKQKRDDEEVEHSKNVLKTTARTLVDTKEDFDDRDDLITGGD